MCQTLDDAFSQVGVSHNLKSNGDKSSESSGSHSAYETTIDGERGTERVFSYKRLGLCCNAPTFE